MKYFHVNAFAEQPYRGNPAMVVLLEREVTDEKLRMIAEEFHAPITVFLSTLSDGKIQIRWFTPTQEIDICGHGTMAAAHILWELDQIKEQHIEFYHPTGTHLQVERFKFQYTLTFPVIPISHVQIEPLWKKVLPISINNAALSNDYLILELNHEEEVIQAYPDTEIIKQLPFRGVAITSKGNQYDFISRYFAPKIGIDEDQVTGSIHCALAPYWEEKLGKQQLHAYQASKRGGELKINYTKGENVKITASALTLGKGELVCV